MIRYLIAAALLCGIGTAAAETYPARTVTVVVPFAAASGTDIMARELADELAKRLGKPVVVENRPGANGVPAAEYVSRAAPDGYILFMGGNTTHSVNPYLFKTLKYDPVRDFTPISRLATAGAVLVVSPKGEIRSVADLVRFAKESPGRFTYGAPNSGSQVAAERIKKIAQIDITRVPYRSTPQAMTDVVSGSVTMTFVDVAAALSQINGGQLRGLAITSAARTPLLPDLPTMQESGFPGFDIVFWNGLFGPANLPPDVTATLDRAAREIMAEPTMHQRLASLGLQASHLPAAEMDAFVRTELVKWGELVRDAGIEPN